MNQIVEFQTNSGESVWVELDETLNATTEDAEMQSVSSQDKVAGKFEHAVGTLKAVANAVMDKLGNIANAPDQVEVKVGLKFNIEAGVIIARTSTEGNLSVTMRWDKKKS